MADVAMELDFHFQTLPGHDDFQVAIALHHLVVTNGFVINLLKLLIVVGGLMVEKNQPLDVGLESDINSHHGGTVAPTFFFHGVLKAELGIKYEGLAIGIEGDIFIHYPGAEVFVFSIGGVDKSTAVFRYFVGE